MRIASLFVGTSVKIANGDNTFNDLEYIANLRAGEGYGSIVQVNAGDELAYEPIYGKDEENKDKIVRLSIYVFCSFFVALIYNMFFVPNDFFRQECSHDANLPM